MSRLNKRDEITCWCSVQMCLIISLYMSVQPIIHSLLHFVGFTCVIMLCTIADSVCIYLICYLHSLTLCSSVLNQYIVKNTTFDVIILSSIFFNSPRCFNRGNYIMDKANTNFVHCIRKRSC